MERIAIHPRDRAALRLSLGVGLAVFVAYGLALPIPFVVCVMAVLMLCKPGPPLPLAKGLFIAGIFGVLVLIGGLMVPLLENYALAGILLTAAILFTLFFTGLTSGNPLTMVLVLSFALIPVAGVAEQSLVLALAGTLAIGVGVGTLVSAISNILFPDPSGAAGKAKVSGPPPAVARWIALRATLIVMPVFVLALTNPSFYLAAIMKTVALGQQAGDTDARSAGRELVGSTLAGAGMAALAWAGLSLWPSLWMLALWLMAVALWSGSGLFGTRHTAYRPSFWSNALFTTLILLGPAIEDSANGKSVLQGALMRTSLFIGVALYAWAAVWVLERWRGRDLECKFDLMGGEQ
ncbi:DUF2955 domain-containing protein [Crenobacter sp. SG2303]|uniref:DUF2955 domain-containing protein n=1 Tax=Crenobacter oryzisoli TaxID=3056844 RepID=A0ABT7XQZ3_9NEIS|nr:DUF2955 domain-containing protein [Crenobacter sp. SG2303]MDN0076202.1 DUF2955 domain-containing protein [Crenobacter sp. SG2303]